MVAKEAGEPAEIKKPGRQLEETEATYRTRSGINEQIGGRVLSDGLDKNNGPKNHLISAQIDIANIYFISDSLADSWEKVVL